jgi:hypothetical protein
MPAPISIARPKPPRLDRIRDVLKLGLELSIGLIDP